MPKPRPLTLLERDRRIRDAMPAVPGPVAERLLTALMLPASERAALIGHLHSDPATRSLAELPDRPRGGPAVRPRLRAGAEGRTTSRSRRNVKSAPLVLPRFRWRPLAKSPSPSAAPKVPAQTSTEAKRSQTPQLHSRAIPAALDDGAQSGNGLEEGGRGFASDRASWPKPPTSTPLEPRHRSQQAGSSHRRADASHAENSRTLCFVHRPRSPSRTW